MKKSLLILLLLLMAIPVHLYADGGTDSGYSPYSKFGIGTLNRQGTAATLLMGGSGVAMRDNRYINILNPAAVTARDSLSFMVDFGIFQGNTYYKQKDSQGAEFTDVSNTFNVNDVVLSFPIWKSSAVMIGLVPFSSVGYDFIQRITDPEIIGYTGNITDSYSGSGSIYQLFVAAGVTFWKRLSLGVQFNYFFGTLDKGYYRTFSSSTYRTLYSGSEMRLKGFNCKLGLQYEQPIGKKDKIIVGGTYRFKTDLEGDNVFINYALQSSVVDTLSIMVNDKDSKWYSPSVDLSSTSIPWEVAVGLSYGRADRYRIEVNYTYSDWTTSNFENIVGFRTGTFSSAVSQSVNAGFEYTPNRSDIRYYMKRCAYRGGLYYIEENFSYSGKKITTLGMTLGITFPVFRWLNGITVGLDFGRRSYLPDPLAPGMIREMYINFAVGINLFDIWFVKHRYE